VLTTSLLVPDTSIAGEGVGTVDDPDSTEVTLLIPPLVEVATEPECVFEFPSAEVGAELIDRTGPTVEGAGSGTIVGTAADSGSELVAATMLLELCTSSVKILVMDVMSMTVEEIVSSELVT
jgi:hypothetical protein